MQPQCVRCASEARFVWIDSEGLTSDTFQDVIEHGVKATLLQHNRTPLALCPTCCVQRITDALTIGELSYIEVCSPAGAAPGIVLPMAY